MTPRPNCECHGEPMASNGRQKSGRPKYQCSVLNRERVARWYENCTFRQYAVKHLRNRRGYALKRMQARHG